MNTSRLAASFLLAFAAADAAAQGLLPVRGNVVAATGDAVAALPGVTIGNTGPFDTAVMDRDGNVLFRARLVGTGISTLNDRGLFFGRSSGDLQMFLQSGAQEPSLTLPGVTLNTTTTSTGAPSGGGLPSSYRISPTGGIIMFGASLNGPGVVYTGTGINSTAIYWGTPSNLLILARRGDAAPSGGSVLNSSFSSVSGQPSALNGSGIAAFKSALLGGDVNGTVNDNAWIRGTPNNLSFVIREGDVLPNGAAIATLGFNVMMNEAGAVLHDETLSTTLGTTPATTNDDKIILITDLAGVHSTLMREGDAAPGTVGAIYFGSPTVAQGFTNAGEGAFLSQLAGGDTNTGINDYGVFGGAPGNVQLYVRKGDALLGMAQGESLGTITSGIAFTSAGAAFVGFVTGPNVSTANDAAICFAAPGAALILAREGDAAPGIAGGVFSSIVNGTSTPVMNGRGQIIFQASVTDANGTINALYSYDPTRGLELQLAGNESFGSNPNMQQVTNISGPLQFGSGDDSCQGLLGDGEFVTRPFFTGGSLSAIVKGHIGALQGTPDAIPATGGTHTMSVDAGAANAGKLYLVAGTASGTRPGFAFGGMLVPLTADFWFNGSLAAANTAFYSNTFGLLDGQGKATAQLNFPNFPAFAGLSLHHAFVVVDLATGLPTMVSEPKPVLVY